MKRITLLLMGLIGFQFAVIAQESNITGQIKDNQTKDNIPFCKVVAFVGNDSIVQGAYTDDNGFFTLPLEPGAYTLVLSTYGYLNDTIHTGPVGGDQYLGIYKLKKDIQVIDEVKVEASSRIELLDKDVQIITEEHKQGASATKNVLHRLPGISYDEYSGQLRVDGDPNIMILVNGVEKSAEYIENLDPEKLLRVETMRDPGGRYGLEGYSAVINVILRNDYVGTELFVRNMNLADIDYSPFSMDYMIGQLGLTYNYTRNKLNFYAGASARRNNFKIRNSATTTYDDGYRIEETPRGDNSNMEILEYNVDYTLGLDYRINPKHTISFETYVEALPKTYNAVDINTFTEVFQGDSLMDSYEFASNTNSRRMKSYSSIFYISELNNKNRLNTNLTYSYYENDYEAVTSQESTYSRNEIGKDRKQYTRLNIELDHDLTSNFSWQTGYGNTWRELKNSFSYDQLDIASNSISNNQSDFYLTDTRHKLYTNLSWKFGKRWGIRAGIAGESSQPRTGGQTLNYFIAQPLFDLRYATSKNLNLMLKYRTENSYPQLEQINPFTSLINPRATTSGNPLLKPSTVHQFSLRVNAWQGKLSVEPYMHYSNNTIAKVGELGADSMFNFRYENASLYQRAGVEMNFNHMFPFRLMVQGNLDLYQSTIVSTSRTNSLMDWRADVDLIYIFKKQNLVGLKYQRQTNKHITGLGYEKGEIDFWLLFYQQPLFKQRGSLMVGYFLPLDIGTSYNQGSRVENTGFVLQNNVDVSIVKNMFIVEFTYRFNKGDAVKKTKKSLKLENENSSGGMF